VVSVGGLFSSVRCSLQGQCVIGPCTEDSFRKRNVDYTTDHNTHTQSSRLRLKCDGTRAETRFCLSAKRTSPFKSAGMSVQSTTGSRGARISRSNAGYTKFRGSVKGTGYPLHSPVSLSLPLPCVTVCHHISTGLYLVNPNNAYFTDFF
jgi:hypothetical protein